MSDHTPPGDARGWLIFAAALRGGGAPPEVSGAAMTVARGLGADDLAADLVERWSQAGVGTDPVSLVSAAGAVADGSVQFSTDPEQDRSLRGLLISGDVLPSDPRFSALVGLL